MTLNLKQAQELTTAPTVRQLRDELLMEHGQEITAQVMQSLRITWLDREAPAWLAERARELALQQRSVNAGYNFMSQLSVSSNASTDAFRAVAEALGLSPDHLSKEQRAAIDAELATRLAHLSQRNEVLITPEQAEQELRDILRN